MTATRLPLYAHREPGGEVTTTWLIADGGAVAVEADAVVRGLPAGAVAAVMRRYGRPLAVALPPPPAAVAADGGRVSSFRFRGWGDVEEKDYVRFEPAEGEAVAAPAPLVCAALLALARATTPA